MIKRTNIPKEKSDLWMSLSPEVRAMYMSMGHKDKQYSSPMTFRRIENVLVQAIEYAFLSESYARS